MSESFNEVEFMDGAYNELENHYTNTLYDLQSKIKSYKNVADDTLDVNEKIKVYENLANVLLKKIDEYLIVPAFNINI